MRRATGNTMEYNITHDAASGACIVSVRGDIDAAVTPELRSAIDLSLESGCRNVVIDLREVTYADSSALGLLVWLDHRLRPIDGRLVLASANRDVTRVLELSGLVQVAATVATSPNVSAALEGLELPETPPDALWSHQIAMPARVEALARAREEACETVSRLRFGEAALFDIKVALGEALANAVRHGSPEGGDATVLVDVDAYDDRVVIRVADTGCGFDGVHSCSGDIYDSGGRGVMFMRALMDRVDFSEGPGGGTVVTLVKHRASGEAT